MTKKEIQALFAQGKIKKALEIMLSMAEQQENEDVSTLLFLKSASFQQNEKSQRMGIISSDNYNITRARITNVLLESIDDLDFETSTDEPAPKLPPKGNKISQTILFLASNPSGTGKLQLEAEHSRINQKLQDSELEVKIKKDVSLSAFQKYIIQEEPFIVHFSGHGEKSDVELKEAMTRGGLDIDEMESNNDSGIVLFSEDLREAFIVSTDVISRLFRGMVKIQNIAINTVIFNSCYSEEQAAAVAEFVPNVIGTSWSVKDKAAIAFSTSFYLGIAEGRNILQSVFLGTTNAMAHGEPPERFVLFQDGKKVDL